MNDEEKAECDWGWLECSVTCGGGVQKSKILWVQDGDTQCDPPKKRPCNGQPCK